jgi:hypothetical protein
MLHYRSKIPFTHNLLEGEYMTDRITAFQVDQLKYTVDPDSADRILEQHPELTDSNGQISYGICRENPDLFPIWAAVYNDLLNLVVDHTNPEREINEEPEIDLTTGKGLQEYLGMWSNFALNSGDVTNALVFAEMSDEIIPDSGLINGTETALNAIGGYKSDVNSEVDSWSEEFQAQIDSLTAQLEILAEL